MKLLNYLFGFFKTKPLYAPNTIDYGRGYRGRKLIDGRYVLEVEGVDGAIDLMCPQYNWKPDVGYYTDCIAPSAKVLDKIAKKIMAERGVSFVNEE